VASVLVLGPLWLESRFWLLPPQHLRSTATEYHRINRELKGRSTGDRTTKFLSVLPGNQICDLEVTRKELELPRPIPGLDGFKLGHLSDLHFTGQYSLEHYHRVLDRFLELQPDLIVLTGDIIDYPEYIQWIEPLLGRLSAPLGCTYLLGNHDLRLPSIQPLLAEMAKLGHCDIGAQDQLVQHGEVRIQITGNERPWFERHSLQRDVDEQTPTAGESAHNETSILRMGLSHTPDQIAWARRRKLDLLLAGHTHGGQFRFPGIGPILSPSMHGSKFASGVFYLQPTLMHVSRGVAGTHPLRWWCPPEVSLLTLRSRSK
jgi:predicted MPP superfamily phosphohydrolase